MKNIFPSKPFKILLLILIAVFALNLISKPFKIKGSNKYLQSGDRLLSEMHYTKADFEYQKALFLNPKNEQAQKHQKIAQESETDINKLSNSEVDLAPGSKDLFKKATAFPKNEKSAVILAKSLIEQGQYQLAILPAKTAIEMDQNYRDAWLYVGIASLKCSELCELSIDAKNFYKDQARNSLDKALRLDPDFEPTKQFLQLARAS